MWLSVRAVCTMQCICTCVLTVNCFSLMLCTYHIHGDVQTNFRFRRLQRESRDRVQQKVEEEMSTIVRHEMDQVRRKLATICDSRSNMVATKNPVTLLTDIFTVFHTYLAGYQSAKVNAFLQLLWKQERVQQMFLLAIYVGAYGVERREEEGRGMGGVTREENRDVHQAMMQPVILHRTHGGRHIVIVFGNCNYTQYSGTPLIRTLLGQKKVSWLGRCPYFRG